MNPERKTFQEAHSKLLMQLVGRHEDIRERFCAAIAACPPEVFDFINTVAMGVRKLPAEAANQSRGGNAARATTKTKKATAA